MESNTLSFVWKAILKMRKPFCIIDLYARLYKKGVTDRELILQVLDEMYDAGLIDFHKIEGVVDEDGEEVWGFTVTA